jgi:lysophospholipase L1-like esterase
MSDTFNTTVTNWQGVDDEPTAGSENLVKSGGVAKNIYYATGYSSSGYGLTVELGENNAVTVTIYYKTTQYIWHSGGSVQINRAMSGDVVLTFTRVSNVIYTIYFNPDNKTFSYAETPIIPGSSNLVDVPAGAIILEEFWTYGTTKPTSGFINFSIDQNEHIGFNLNSYNQLNSMKATPGQLKKIAELEEEIAELKSSRAPFPYSGKIFLQVGCIGDSYTEGYQYSEGSPTYPNYDYAWPHYISKITGNNWINFAKSGSSSKSWVTESNPKYTNMDAVRAKKCQAYIIGLGINDGSATTSTRVALGTIDDIETDADSYYAYYYKLIQNLLLINPKAIIFCNTGAAVKDAYNQAIRDIVDYCKNNNQQVWLCDLARDYNTTEYYLNPVFVADHVNGHYTAIGYEFMAECYIKVISDVINANQTQFREVETIPFDE